MLPVNSNVNRRKEVIMKKEWLFLANRNSSMPLQFVLFADAYLDSAALLCKALKRSTVNYQSKRAVVLSLTFHAVELFESCYSPEKSEEKFIMMLTGLRYVSTSLS